MGLQGPLAGPYGACVSLSAAKYVIQWQAALCSRCIRTLVVPGMEPTTCPILLHTLSERESVCPDLVGHVMATPAQPPPLPGGRVSYPKTLPLLPLLPPPGSRSPTRRTEMTGEPK